MSNGYGVDFYGVATYGYSQPANYSVTPFNAFQSNYNEITLKWQSPNVTPWKSLMLVRSIYGYPAIPADGVTILTITPSAPLTSFDDIGLLPGHFYYYTMFLNLEATTWTSGGTFNTGDIVLYQGLYWRSLSNSNTGNTPSSSSAFWTNTQYAPTWFPAGSVASLVVNNNGYSSLLYNRTPQPYKVAQSDIFSNTVIDNPALLHYLSLFGFHLDMTKTEYDIYLQSNNPSVISVSSLDILGQQLGIRTDYISSPQARRQRVKNITANYRLKGTTQGLHNAIASITGWNSVITTSPNLMLSGDNSSFAHPQYDQWDAATTYFPNQIIQFSNINYKNLVQSVGTAQQPTGTTSSNTWWQPQIEQTDTVVLKDPVINTGLSGFAGWTISADSTYDSHALQTGIVTGVVHPTNSAIQNWNALGFRFTGTPTGGIIANTNLSTEFDNAWSSSTNYVVNNYVYITGTTNIAYQAMKPSGPGTVYGAITPGTNESFWRATFQPTGFQGVSYPFEFFDLPYTVATPNIAQWNSAIRYSVGTQVIFFGLIYQALNVNINSKPTGNYYSNSDWIFVRIPENIYTGSAYFTRITSSTTATTASVDMGFTVQDANGVGGIGPIFYAAGNPYVNRFSGDYPNLNGINDNSLTYLGSNYAWTAVPTTANLWRSTYGMASVDQTLFGTTTYVYLYYTSALSDANLYLTFASDYVDTAHKGHGILFRRVDANNFWYTTRKSLYRVSGGVETLMASWTRLNDGDRMKVHALGSVITVSKYTRTGTAGFTTLASITDSANITGVQHGLIQKFSPSGAV